MRNSPRLNARIVTAAVLRKTMRKMRMKRSILALIWQVWSPSICHTHPCYKSTKFGVERKSTEFFTYIRLFPTSQLDTNKCSSRSIYPLSLSSSKIVFLQYWCCLLVTAPVHARNDHVACICLIMTVLVQELGILT